MRRSFDSSVFFGASNTCRVFYFEVRAIFMQDHTVWNPPARTLLSTQDPVPTDTCTAEYKYLVRIVYTGNTPSTLLQYCMQNMLGNVHITIKREQD